MKDKKMERIVPKKIQSITRVIRYRLDDSEKMDEFTKNISVEGKIGVNVLHEIRRGSGGNWFLFVHLTNEQKTRCQENGIRVETHSILPVSTDAIKHMLADVYPELVKKLFAEDIIDA